MTARHQLRLGKRLGRDRNPIDATAAPPVGETLQLARERKGVDLYRAERDTKIRMQYLAALEDGDWEDLPAPVYTKGFLRNYAIYLGLDPDDVLDHWRDEMEQLRTATRVAVAPPPMPLVEPGGRRFTLSPAIIVAGLVVLVICLFIGYLGVQFLRFVDVTQVALTYPANVVSTVNADQVTLQGTAGRGAIISITGPDGTPYSTTADENGNWSRTVPLARGRNNFQIMATDPVTQRDSTPVQLVITVPLPSVSPNASQTAAPPAPITMQLFTPTSGTTTTDPNVTVSGATTGTRITIASSFVASPPATPAPSGLPVASPSHQPSGSPQASGAPSLGPAADISLTTNTFSQALVFPVGQWHVTVTSYATGVAPLAQDFVITVQPAPVTVHNLDVYVANPNVNLTVTADNLPVLGLQNVKAQAMTHYTAVAQNEFCIHTNRPGGVSVTLDGETMGLLAAAHAPPGSFIIKPGQAPTPASSPC